MGARCSSPRSASSSTAERLRPTFPPIRANGGQYCVGYWCSEIPRADIPDRCIAAIYAGRYTLACMSSRRSVVDYGLARRATLASVLSGHTTLTDVCDAHPYLLRAAKYHGEPTQTRCPICKKSLLTHVTYVYGAELGQYEGRVKQTRELDQMAAEYGEFRVYVVEVCQRCGGDPLASSYVLGTGEPAVRRGRRARTSQ